MTKAELETIRKRVEAAEFYPFTISHNVYGPTADFLFNCFKDVPKLLAEVERLRAALRGVMDNVGVPQPGYPAPIAHAYDIANEALENK